jgi:hypothetical protein
MRRTILIFGTIAGLILAIPLLALMIAIGGEPSAGFFRNGQLFGYTTMLIALSTVFVAIKRQRDVDGGGVIRFWPAFGLGLAISAVAGLIYAVAWEIALAMTGGDFIGAYAEYLVAEERSKGASPTTLARLTADMNAFRESYANPLVRIPLTFVELFPVGLLVSLVSAALLRNPRFLPARQR